MEEELNISIQILPKEKEIFIAEECSSGASYKFNSINEIAEKVRFYLENYYKREIEGTEEKEIELLDD